jgi:uncharacterized protein (DUF1330 family)
MRSAATGLILLSFTLMLSACLGMGGSGNGTGQSSAPSMAAVIDAVRDRHLHVTHLERSPDHAPALGIKLTGANFMVEGSATEGSTTVGRIVVIEFGQLAGVRRIAERLSIPSHGPSYEYRRGVASGHLLIAEEATTRRGRAIVVQAAQRVAAIADR